MTQKPRSTKPLISFYIEPDLLTLVDDYRRKLTPIPPRSTAIKDILRSALEPTAADAPQ